MGSGTPRGKAPRPGGGPSPYPDPHLARGQRHTAPG
nr:MAG TPA: hypothetical protein [Caudoviricetes sp.]